MPPKLAWIGLGNMGQGMSKNLAEKGQFEHPLLLYNRTSERAVEQEACLPKGSSKAVTSIEELVSASDIIFTCMTGEEAIESVLATALQYPVSGKIFIDTSSLPASITSKLTRMVEAQGASFVYCPVFGAAPAAAAGQLICLPSGPPAAVARIMPYCTHVLGRLTIDLSGEDPAKAAMLKSIGNILILAMIEALAETHVFAEKAGVGNDKLHQFIEGMFPGPYVFYSDRMRSGGYHTRETPLSGTNAAVKQLDKVLKVAESVGTRIKLVEVAGEHLRRVKEVMGDRGDVAAIYGAVREEAGLSFEN